MLKKRRMKQCWDPELRAKGTQKKTGDDDAENDDDKGVGIAGGRLAQAQGEWKKGRNRNTHNNAGASSTSFLRQSVWPVSLFCWLAGWVRADAMWLRAREYRRNASTDNAFHEASEIEKQKKQEERKRMIYIINQQATPGREERAQVEKKSRWWHSKKRREQRGRCRGVQIRTQTLGKANEQSCSKMPSFNKASTHGDTHDPSAQEKKRKQSEKETDEMKWKRAEPVRSYARFSFSSSQISRKRRSSNSE